MYGNLEKAYKFAKQKHEGQIRRFSKKPYLTHLIRTYKIVNHYTQDEVMLVAALLHDVVEDTKVKITNIHEIFGEEIAEIVWQVTSIKDKRPKKIALKEKVLKMSSKSKIVKLADRTANVIGLFNPKVNKKFISRYIAETEYVFGGVIIDDNDFKEIQTMLWEKLFKIIKILKIKFN